MVLRLNRTQAIISEGLEDGERICVSSLEAVTDGMKVRVGGTAGQIEQDEPDAVKIGAGS